MWDHSGKSSKNFPTFFPLTLSKRTIAHIKEPFEKSLLEHPWLSCHNYYCLLIFQYAQKWNLGSIHHSDAPHILVYEVQGFVFDEMNWIQPLFFVKIYNSILFVKQIIYHFSLLKFCFRNPKPCLIYQHQTQSQNNRTYFFSEWNEINICFANSVFHTLVKLQ